MFRPIRTVVSATGAAHRPFGRNIRRPLSGLPIPRRLFVSGSALADAFSALDPSTRYLQWQGLALSERSDKNPFG
jgi:hypothetical protein